MEELRLASIPVAEKAAFPNHRTILFDNASHFLQEDVGERIAEAFKSFRSESGE
jgi:pimeloyl-ACP methyl ester carboxylesterase